MKEAPSQLFQVFSFEGNPAGSAGKDSVVGHTDLSPPEGSRWIKFPSESKPLALPEHVIQRLLNENLSDEDDIHRVLWGLLQMYTQQNSLKMEVDEKRKETEEEVGQYRTKREAALTELELHRNKMMQKVDQEIEEKKHNLRLDGNVVLADWTEMQEQLSENPEAMMKNCVTTAQNLKINVALRQETQKRIAEGIDVCGKNMQTHIDKLTHLLDLIDNHESDPIIWPEDIGYWLALGDAMQHLKNNMPYSPVKEDKMSEPEKRKYMSDLDRAEQSAATHLWDAIYKYYPCSGCHAGVLAASHRGGPDGEQQYWKDEMDGYDYGMPCVNIFLPCPVVATVAGKETDKRFYSNPNAEFSAFGAMKTHMPFPKLDKKTVPFNP